MSEPENEAKGFKVEDKRKFTTDGKLRAEAEEVQTREAPEAPGGAREPEGSEDSAGPNAADVGPEAADVGPEAADVGPEAADAGREAADAGREAAAAGQDEQATQTGPTSESGPEVGPPPDLGFMDLVNMLAGNALVALGDLPEPVSGKHVENLESVQVMIAFLDALQKKTKGNLEESEEKILGDLLYDLRMRFMAKANLIKL